MPTTNQLCRNARRRKGRKSKAPALKGCPQRSGTVIQVKIINPKKPNSANRCVCRVMLSDGTVVVAYIPGERNSVSEHMRVLIRGGRVKDLPGVRYHVVRGALDASPATGPTSTSRTEVFRNQSRSRYGVKKTRDKKK